MITGTHLKEDCSFLLLSIIKSSCKSTKKQYSSAIILKIIKSIKDDGKTIN